MNTCHAIPCNCDPNPLTGYSAEAQDADMFLCLGYAQVTPLLGASYSDFQCVRPAHSPVSELAGCLSAYDAAYVCAVSSWTLNGLPVTVFQNQIQTGTVNCSDGLPFSYTVPAGVFPGLSQAEANAKALSYAIEQADLHAICLSDIPNTATVGVPYSAVIVATGSLLAQFPATDIWDFVAGALPPGLTLNNGGFVGGIDLITGGQCPVTGTPTLTGVYSFTLQVTDPAGDTMQKTFTITVTAPVPINAILDSDGNPILDSDGNYIIDSSI